ncbi:MAG: LCP family protein [Methylocystaceae bacterium]
MHKKYTRFIALFTVMILLLGTGIAAGLGWYKHQAADKAEQARAELLNQGIINVLLLGIDARPGETKARSDTMILASIDTTNKKVGLISIPRDTRIKNGDHYQKINAFNFIGGPELAKQKVEELVGVPVNYYVLTNFSGFKEIIDILGGVTIDVDKRMYKPSEDIDLQPGVQRLNGTQALAYCRFRTDALGDIARIQRQQNFIKAVSTEMMQSSTLTKLPRLVPKLNKYVSTDIPMSKLLKIAQAAEQFQQGQSQMVAQSLPGWFYNDPDTGASYWVVDEQKLPGMVDNVLNGKTVDFIEGTLAAEKPKQVKTRKTETPAAQPEEPSQGDTSVDNSPPTNVDNGTGSDTTNPTDPNDSGSAANNGTDQNNNNTTSEPSQQS